MKSKIGFALLAVSFVMFASDRIERFASHRFAGVAWAQDASDADQAARRRIFRTRRDSA